MEDRWCQEWCSLIDPVSKCIQYLGYREYKSKSLLMAVRMFMICVRAILRALIRSSGVVGMGIGARVGSGGRTGDVGSTRLGRVGRVGRVGSVGIVKVGTGARLGSKGTYGIVGKGNTCGAALSTSTSRRSTAVSPI